MTAAPKDQSHCDRLRASLLEGQNLVILSNRGPVTFYRDGEGALQAQRGSGGLVSALTGLAGKTNACWIASAFSDEDRAYGGGIANLDENTSIQVKLLSIPDQIYEGYYNVISNPLLWFLQHSIWDFARTPVIDHHTWDAWENGYVAVNRLFAEAAAWEIEQQSSRSLVMLQDYHLYLAPEEIRRLVRDRRAYTLTHFIHIPWPGTQQWGLLPTRMRTPILEGLCAVDLLGFQTREDGLNFIRTVESYLPEAKVSFRRGLVHYRRHTTHVRDFPISIDVEGLQRLADTPEVEAYRKSLENRFGERQLIVRIDRTEPSKNIVRGFQAFDELLDLHPEHRGKSQFLALLVPSRMEVPEYQTYLDELMAAAGRINARYGDSEWEPVRILVGENYPRAIAALQIYDVLLVNSIADGMNLVAKEGPVVNQHDGVLVLSERTGAQQQLGGGTLVISPCDISATAEGLHQALTMPAEERRERAETLCRLVEEEDINQWLCRQLEELEKLEL